jgi:hypothetical protein
MVEIMVIATMNSHSKKKRIAMKEERMAARSHQPIRAA